MVLDRSRYKVPAELGGEPLDAALAALVPEQSKARLQALILRGAVQRNGGVTARAVLTVQPDDVLDVDFEPESNEFVLPVVYEDAELAAIDKPAGLIVHDNERASGDTVASLAARRWPDLPQLRGPHRPGIVHRLDRETSGVMLVAKTHAAMQELLAAFAERRILKTYDALVHGSAIGDEFEVDASLAPAPGHVDLQVVAPEGQGRAARTRFVVLERYGAFSLVACHPHTGRRHQIRAHLASQGFPIVGDRLYGSLLGSAPPGAPWPARQSLHARRLELVHPTSGAEIAFEAPWPRDLERMRHWCRATRR